MKKVRLKNSITEYIEDKDFIKEPYLDLGNLQDVKKSKPALLLHSCCGPCSTAVVERLIDAYDITIFFYNPNITDKEEYEKRKATQMEFIEKYNKSRDSRGRLGFMEGPYEPNAFYKAATNLEEEPEGGRRCIACFQLRLEKTAETASMTGFQCFATTLTVSPHKNFELIYKIGMQLGMRYGLTYLGEDFKKKAGYQRSVELSRIYELYRQNYCGCSFSARIIEKILEDKK